MRVFITKMEERNGIKMADELDYPINDTAMKQEMITDLTENYNYSEVDAQTWVQEHGHRVVSEMWDAYTDYFERHAEYKGEK